MTETVKGCPTYHIYGTAFFGSYRNEMIAFTKYKDYCAFNSERISSTIS